MPTSRSGLPHCPRVGIPTATRQNCSRRIDAKQIAGTAHATITRRCTMGLSLLRSQGTLFLLPRSESARKATSQTLFFFPKVEFQFHAILRLCEIFCLTVTNPSHTINPPVNQTENGAIYRSNGKLPGPFNSRAPDIIAPSPGIGAVAIVFPALSTHWEMPELPTRKIGTPYSAARTGATRACISCWWRPQSATSIVGTIIASAPMLINLSVTRL